MNFSPAKISQEFQRIERVAEIATELDALIRLLGQIVEEIADFPNRTESHTFTQSQYYERRYLPFVLENGTYQGSRISKIKDELLGHISYFTAGNLYSSEAVAKVLSALNGPNGNDGIIKIIDDIIALNANAPIPDSDLTGVFAGWQSSSVYPDFSQRLSGLRLILLECINEFSLIYQGEDWRKIGQNVDYNAPINLFPFKTTIHFEYDQINDPNGEGELWVRVLPDDIAIEQITSLTDKERDEGQALWTAMADDPTNARMKWGSFVLASGSIYRGAYIADQTKPSNWSAVWPADGQTPTSIDPIFVQKPTAGSDFFATSYLRILPEFFTARLYNYDDAQGDYVIAKEYQFDPISRSNPLVVGFLNTDLLSSSAGTPPDNWLVNFDTAISLGFGARIPLSNVEMTSGFDRLIIAGVSYANPSDTLEDLFRSHYFTAGFNILPTGTPTNNVNERSQRRYQAFDFSADSLFQIIVKGEQNTNLDAKWLESTAGSYPDVTDHDAASAFHTDEDLLKKGLGITNANLPHLPASLSADRAEARPINRMVYESTLGYFIHDMLVIENDLTHDDHLLERSERDFIKGFFINHISGRGIYPTFRVGNQPYGIVPSTDFKRLYIDAQNSENTFRLLNILRPLYDHWMKFARSLPLFNPTNRGDLSLEEFNKMFLRSGAGAFVGAQQTESADYLNILNQITEALLNNGTVQGNISQTDINNLRTLIEDITGYRYSFIEPLPDGSSLIPRFLKLLFIAGNHNNGWVEPFYRRNLDENLTREKFESLVDSYLASEFDTIKYGYPQSQWAFTYNDNYIFDLLGVLPINFGNILEGDFGKTDFNPKMLFFQLIRNSLILEVFLRAIDLIDENGIEHSKYPQFEQPLTDGPIDPTDNNSFQYNRLLLLKQLASACGVTSNSATIGEAVYNDVFDNPTGNTPNNAGDSLRAFFEAAKLVQNMPTARIERLLIEAIDGLSYRLDMWFSAVLESLEGQAYDPSLLRIGGFSVLENLRPASAVIPDPENANQLVDKSSLGHLLAPSLSQAIASSTLLYGSSAFTSDQNRLRLALDSDHVREAIGMLQSAKEGVSVGYILGSLIERLLKSDPNPLLKTLIPNLRTLYPWDANFVNRSHDPAQQLPKRRVTNGYSLAKSLSSHGSQDVANELVSDTDPRNAPLKTHLDVLVAMIDALADLGVAESVYQFTKGNPAREFQLNTPRSIGDMPGGVPESMKTPQTGVSFEQKALVLFKQSPYTTNPTGLTRAMASDFNAWLGSLGPFGSIPISVSITDTGQGTTVNASGLFDPAELYALLETGKGSNQDRQVIILLAGQAAGTIDQTEVLDTSDQLALSQDFKRAQLVQVYLQRMLDKSHSLSANSFNVSSGPFSENIARKQAYALDLLSKAIQVINSRHASLAQATGVTSWSSATQELKDSVVKGVLAAFLVCQANIPAVPVAKYPTGDAGYTPSPDDQTPSPILWQEVIKGDIDKLFSRPSKASQGLAVAKAVLGEASKRLAAVHNILSRYTPGSQFVTDNPGLLDGASVADFALGYVSKLVGIDEKLITPLFLDTESAIAANGVFATGKSFSLDLDLWESQVSRVSDPVMAAFRFRSLVGNAAQYIAPKAFQYPQTPGFTDWIGGPWTAGAQIPEHLTSFVLYGGKQDVNYSNAVFGFAIESWVETIPSRDTTTGVAFQYDQPNASPPQVIIQAINNNPSLPWNKEKVFRSIECALEMAAVRSVTVNDLLSAEMPGGNGEPNLIRHALPGAFIPRYQISGYQTDEKYGFDAK